MLVNVRQNFPWMSKETKKDKNNKNNIFMKQKRKKEENRINVSELADQNRK